MGYYVDEQVSITIDRITWYDLNTSSETASKGASKDQALSSYMKKAIAAISCPYQLIITDAMQLVKMGGVAGLNFYPLFLDDNGDADIETVVEHAEHFLSLGGEKAVCLGGDWDGVDYLPDGLTGIESVGEVYEAMLRRNWKEDLVRDIFYNNLFEFMEKVL